jgi:transglutaminase-like putative cysteine protease
MSADGPGRRRYRVVHTTAYRYSDSVSMSYGRAHLLPRSLPGQDVVAAELVLDPGADELRSHVDFFGNVSTYYAVRTPHRSLQVTSTSEVVLSRVAPSVPELDQLTWEQVRDGCAGDVTTREFVHGSPLVRPSAMVADYAALTFTPARPLGTALHDLVHRIYTDFEYVSGATTVKTTLGEFLHGRKGVCQDFAHLAVGCLRSVGLPARYVSGYLETEPAPGRPKLQGADASHAWAAVSVPGSDGSRWIELDPTNDQFVDARYVVAGWGRDYADVPPLKGIILTDAKRSTMTVSVDVTRSS